MRVRVRLYGDLERLAGARELELELEPQTTVGDLIELLKRLTGGKAEKYVDPSLRESRYILIRNGEVVNNPREELSDGDTIAFVPPVAGGQT